MRTEPHSEVVRYVLEPAVEAVASAILKPCSIEEMYSLPIVPP